MANRKISDLPNLTTPADADLVPFVDASNTLESAEGTSVKVLWSNIKATLKTYFDTLYPSISDLTSYLRSDIADTKTAGDLTFNDNVKTLLGTGGLESEIYSDGSNTITNLLSGDEKRFNNGVEVTNISRTDGTITPASGVLPIVGKLNLGFGQSVYIGFNSGNVDDGTNNYNVGIGYQVLKLNTSGATNVGLGLNTLEANTTGSSNSGIGSSSLKSNTTGSNNVALGGNTLSSNTTDSNNAAIGFQALTKLLSGASNTAIGNSSLSQLVTGAENTGIGKDAGLRIVGGAVHTTCDNSVYIGTGTRASANGNTNETVIGDSAEGNGSNTVTIGNSSVTDNYFQGNIHTNDVVVDTEVYGAGWNGSNEVPTKDAVYDKIESLVFGVGDAVLANSQTFTGVNTFNNPAGAGINSIASSSSGILAQSSSTAIGINATHTGTGTNYLSQITTATSAEHFKASAGASSTGNFITCEKNSVENYAVDVDGNVEATSLNVKALNAAPATATDTGTTGEIRYTATHIYVCTATNTWVRAALATW